MSENKSWYKRFFDRFGLSFVMVASYFGSGSIFIASQAGVEYGYVLIWAVIGAVLLGFMAQDMSARLGMFGDTLMGFIRKRLGKPVAVFLAIFLAIGCILWTIELAAAIGMAIEVLTGAALSWQVAAVVTTLFAVVIGVMNYGKIEVLMTTMMVALLLLYAVVAAASGPSVVETVKGLIPRIPDQRALVLGAAILGTTALWPNFFLESILVRNKGWNSRKDLRAMRMDLTLGYAVGGLITIAIVVVAAAVLRPAGYTDLTDFTVPGLALEEILGEWAMVAFLIGVIGASFNSIIPIMWTVPYMLLEALDAKDKSEDSKAFKGIYMLTTATGVLAPLVHSVMGLSVIQMIILFPAYNGVFGLPITAALLFWAVNDKRIMGEHVNTWRLNLMNITLVIFSVYISLKSGSSVLSEIFGG